MKYIAWTLIFLTLAFLLMKLTKFEEREKAQNKYMCAVYGYYEDCKTPLREEDKLK